MSTESPTLEYVYGLTDDNEPESQHIIIGANGVFFASAPLIAMDAVGKLVLAANSHAALVAALRVARGYVNNAEALTVRLRNKRDADLAQIDAALATA